MPIGSATHLPPFNQDSVAEGQDWFPSTLLRSDSGASIGANECSSWSFKVYDSQSISEDTALYSSGTLATSALNPDGSRILYTSVQTGAKSRHPLGFTLRHLVDLVGLLSSVHGGHTYLAEYKFATASNSGLGTITFRAEAALWPSFS